MTRQEYDGLSSMDDLYNFIYQYDLADELRDADIDLYTYDEVTGLIDDEIRDFIDYYSWDRLRDALDDLALYPGSFFVRNGTLDYTCIDDDFTYYHRVVGEFCEENGYFEDDEEDAGVTQENNTVNPFVVANESDEDEVIDFEVNEDADAVFQLFTTIEYETTDSDTVDNAGFVEEQMVDEELVQLEQHAIEHIMC